MRTLNFKREEEIKVVWWDIKVLRRRAAAMSPREKRIVLLSALGLFLLAFYFIPSFLYATLIFLFCCFACYYNSGETLLNARLGPNPRAGLNLHAGLRRWLADWGATGLSVNSPGGTRISSNTEVESQYRQRLGDTGIYRREALASDSFFYSPRDFLMGSYIGKPESPSSGSVRPRAGRNPREQLREKLSRPNHAVYTPNRRLSFAGYVFYSSTAARPLDDCTRDVQNMI